MTSAKLTYWILVYTLVNLAVCPTALYFIFKDFNLSSISQTWQNILSAMFLIVMLPYYLYLASWLLVVCYPVTLEKLEKRFESLLCPIGLSILVSVIQAEWVTSLLLTATVLSLAVSLTCVVGTGSTYPASQSSNTTPQEQHSELSFEAQSPSRNNSRESDRLIIQTQTVQVTQIITMFNEND